MLAAIFLGLISGLIAVVAVAAAVTGDTVEAIGFGLAAILAGHVTAIGITGLRHPRPATEPPSAGVNDRGESGLAFPYARLPYYLITVTLVLVALLAAGFTAVMAAGGSATGWVLAAISGGFAVFASWFLIVLLRLAPGTIVLTPSGIYHRSLVLEHFVPWDAVVDVQARDGPNPWITVKALPMDGTRERRHTGRLHTFEGGLLPFLVARTSWLGANAVPAYQAIRFYFDHPDQRPQLHAGDLPTSR
ncbi:hypothetical protein GCM10010112_79510 [Actinoplanes lobatus]|uniref:PH domain-containing protein n=1 Tax=Actinoplanes lobatus TaxID=113568 RepID=A0A7W7MHY0_9ACTN|nr:hypothetical protein [Actinoplanes lobatus]MBB4750841.1 hypothetical protein [Actinoplanes lobatus]GGN92380.1 hypothetical protein GCM10010112_79510 [Actinoplanes lobatus]GIE44396.1 hypothetical protein Alo02nite_72940 [Actinoplanes lobatus]